MGELFQTGSTVAQGRYRITELLGSGGMAQVFRARDERLGRFVALKAMRHDLPYDPGWVTRFRREAQTMAGLSHPNIVSVHDTGEERRAGGGRPVPYLVMELVAGRSLAELLDAQGRLPLAEALPLALQILAALAAAHARGVVHRDIKPANVLLAEDGTAKVADFGIAAVAGRTVLTGTGAVLGTPHYMSPEQVEGRRDLDGRSDLYSLGVLLFRMLSGRVPFDADSAWSVGYAHLHTPPPSLASLGISVPGAVESLLARALAKDPGDRYHDAAAMRAAVEALARAEDEQATRPQAPFEFGLADLFPPASSAPPRPRAETSRTALVELLCFVPVLLSVGWTVVAQSRDTAGAGTITVVSACGLAWTWYAFLRRDDSALTGWPRTLVRAVAAIGAIVHGVTALAGLGMLAAEALAG
ncbi:protein kinase [Streptomyces sp. 2P-4]|uniref:protein kinase domain-containing protein n=1 Tax=Streptomyces sp. 2P-4 TaxID=2931974 RepID=UPI0025415B00|nr:protein kinase [Streptomyces sp. 2P-4]